MKYSTLLALLFTTLFAWAQRPDFESLKQDIEQAETNEAKVRALTRYGDALPNSKYEEINAVIDSIQNLAEGTDEPALHLASNEFLKGVREFKARNLEAAKPYLKRSITAFQQLDDDTEFRALNILGLIYIYTQQRDSAVYLFKNVLNRISPENKRGILSAHGNLGLAYRQMGNFGQALMHFEKVYEMDSTDAFSVVNVSMNMARMYIDIEMYDKAIQTLNRVDISKLPDIPPKAVYFNNLADAYQLKDQLDSAEYYYQKAHDLGEQIRFKQGQFINAGNLTEVKLELEKFEEVPALLSEMDRIKKASRVRHAEVRLQLLTAQYWLALSEPDSALIALSKAERATENPAFEEYRIDVYKEYINAYNQKNDPEKAKEYLDRFEAENDSPAQARKERFLADAKASYLLAIKEGELAESHEVIEVFSSQRLILGIMVVLMITIALVLFRNYKKSSTDLASKEAENETLSQEVKRQKTQILELKSKALLDIPEIVSIKSDGHYLEFSLKKKDKPEIDRNRLKNVLQVLPDYFIQIHRSYIINLKEVRIKYADKIEMKNGQELPVSRSYKSGLNDALSKFNFD